jgi:hypothetical protein
VTYYTSPDNLPAPDDYQQPADSPSAFRALADATQAALTAVKGYATSRVLDSVSGGHADLAPSIRAVGTAINDVLAKYVNAGAGLAGGGQLSGNPTLNVGAGAGISVSADAVAIDTTWADARWDRVRAGKSPLTTVPANSPKNITVTMNLPWTPTAIIASVGNETGSQSGVVAVGDGYTAASFTAAIRNIGGAEEMLSVHWVAIR